MSDYKTALQPDLYHRIYGHGWEAAMEHVLAVLDELRSAQGRPLVGWDVVGVTTLSGWDMALDAMRDRLTLPQAEHGGPTDPDTG